MEIMLAAKRGMAYIEDAHAADCGEASNGFSYDMEA